MKEFLTLFIGFLIFALIDHLMIKYEIKKNIDLFYDLYRHEIIKELHLQEKSSL